MTKNNNNMFLISYNLSVIIFFITILFSETYSTPDYRYEACGPENCGTGPSISFPFYIVGRQKSYCGYPGFALNCSPDGHPVLQLPQNEYVVGQISYQNRSFHVYDAVVLEPDSNNDSCFPGIQNTTLPSPRYNFVSTPGLIHLFSGCPIPLPEGLRRYNVSYCDNWDLAILDGDENLVNATEICDTNVVAPVGDEGRIGNSNISEVLRRGFDMNWMSSDCDECAASGGRCGFDSSNYHFRCFCPDRPHSRSCLTGTKKFQNILFKGGVVMVALTFTVIIVFLSIRKNYTLLKLLGILKSETGKDLDIELFLKEHGELAPKRYKYSDLKKMTKSFGENLGKGGYGSVYKGKLPDGRLVAVKILNESKGNGEEFINEVASISRTSHINVVTLVGFCFEDSKRALIYDFMPNGSLEKYIQNNVSSSEEEGGLGWETLFEIALCVARGLAYLHEGCNTRILHFDIKPHNILLDKDFKPKISDFGLAKLCPNRSSIVSVMVARGTIGYIAPEVFCSNFGAVSYKSDVYSYGMMVLEIAGEKKRIDRGDVDRTSETYFPQYIYKQLELMDGTRLDDHEIVNEGASDLAKRKLIIVGLWCIQTDPKDRPPMSKVVEMLEGKIESLQVPPKPYLSSPPRFELNFSTTSQSTV